MFYIVEYEDHIADRFYVLACAQLFALLFDGQIYAVDLDLLSLQAP